MRLGTCVREGVRRGCSGDRGGGSSDIGGAAVTWEVAGGLPRTRRTRRWVGPWARARGTCASLGGPTPPMPVPAFLAEEMTHKQEQKVRQVQMFRERAITLKHLSVFKTSVPAELHVHPTL